MWDYENRATSIQLPSGIRNTMAYEPGGLRVKLEESTETKKFVWDDQNYLAETDGSNDTQVVYTNEPRYYGNLISQRRGSTTSWYHFDALGSTRQLTDAMQTVTDQRLYDAWGTVIESSGSTVYHFQYNGRVGYHTDSDHDAIYIRARLYELVTGRWQSRDPLGFSDSLNSYLYSINCPAALVDPSGEKCITCGDFSFLTKVYIDQMDTLYEGTPFRRLADGSVASVNVDLAATEGVQFPKLKRAGLHYVDHRVKPGAALHWLFFVTIDICETTDPPGECLLFLDETGTTTTWGFSDGKVRVHGGKNWGSVRSHVKAPIVDPSRFCDKAIIFVDFPGAGFEVGVSWFSKKLKQKFEVKDSVSMEVMASARFDLNFKVTQDLEFDPFPDETYRQRPN